MTRQSKPIKLDDNVNAALFALSRGLSVKGFGEKLANLPVYSRFSSYKMLDVFVELEVAGKIQIDDQRGTMIIVDESLRQQIERNRQLGEEQLRKLNINLSEICIAQ